MQERPLIRKLGTIDCGMVETTPIVFSGRLYRFESVRPDYMPGLCPPEIRVGWTHPGGYFRFVDVESGEPTQSFAQGYHLGCALVANDTVYAFGLGTRPDPPDETGSRIQVFWSKDLENWSSRTALVMPGWGAFNTTVCRGRDRYAMGIEMGEPAELVGVRFTVLFAVSDNLQEWDLLPEECNHTKERYAGCPSLRFFGDHYYMIYAERSGNFVVRSKDLAQWEYSPFNPVFVYSDEDKIIANQELTAAQKAYIGETENRKAGDIDLCEVDGETIIYYDWGYRGRVFLAEARYDGSLESFFTSMFPG